MNFGGFLGIGNSSAKTDRGNQLAGINASWNIYNRGLPLGDTASQKSDTATEQGTLGLDAAKKYWTDILHGDRPAVMQAAAPAVSAINEQADASRSQQAEMGTSRGGGTNEANQTAESDRMTQMNNLVAGLQPAAAKEVESISQKQLTSGEAQMREALSALGLSQDVANEIINSSIQSRPISIAANQAVVQQWSNLLAALGL